MAITRGAAADDDDGDDERRRLGHQQPRQQIVEKGVRGSQDAGRLGHEEAARCQREERNDAQPLHADEVDLSQNDEAHHRIEQHAPVLQAVPQEQHVPARH